MKKGLRPAGAGEEERLAVKFRHKAKENWNPFKVQNVRYTSQEKSSEPIEKNLGWGAACRLKPLESANETGIGNRRRNAGRAKKKKQNGNGVGWLTHSSGSKKKKEKRRS